VITAFPNPDVVKEMYIQVQEGFEVQKTLKKGTSALCVLKRLMV